MAFTMISRRGLLLKSAALTALASAGALAGPALASEPRRGGTLRVAVNETIDTFDPFTTNNTLVRTMHNHVFGQLYTYDGRYGLIPELAAGHEVSDDGLTWTFTLVEGIVFHDGSVLEAEDVVASWERFLEISPRTDNFSDGFERIYSPDSQTVVFEYSKPQGPFLDKLSAPHTGFKILPRGVARASLRRPLEDAELIGTGPFRIKEWRRGEALVMARFENFHSDTRYDGPDGLGGRRTVYVDELVWNFVSEPGAHDAGLKSNRFDLASSVPPETRNAFEALPGLSGTVIRPLNWLNMMVNHHNPPMDDLRIRRAVQMGIDRYLVMLGTFGDPDLVRLSPGLAFEEQVWFSRAGEEHYQRHDKEMARALIAESDYDGREIVLMTTRTIGLLYNSAVIIQSELQSIGLNVRLEVMDWVALLGHITNLELRPNWHLSSMFHSIRHDPFGWDLNFRSDRWTPYASEEMDRSLDLVANSHDFDERYAAFENVQRLFHEDVVNVKIGDQFGWHAHRDTLRGYQSFNGFIFWDVWLDG